MFCKHKWKVQSEHVSESMLEKTLKATGTCGKPFNIDGLDRLNMKKHVVIMTCEKCGKIKKVVTKV